MNALTLLIATVLSFFKKSTSKQPLPPNEGAQEIQFLRHVKTYPIIEPQVYPFRER